MTPRQLEILQHSLGVDEYGRTPRGFTPYTRNHFCAGDADEATCRSLIVLGYMVQHRTTEVFPDFNCSVTDAGKKAMRGESPAPPKPTRSQKRYQDYLSADSSMNFGEWMFPYEVTFDHEAGRTAGHRDDRIEVNGVIQNAAVHLLCNGLRGSSRASYKFQSKVGV